MSKQIGLSLVAALLLTGCSFKDSWEVRKDLEPMRKDKVIVYDEVPVTSKIRTEENILRSNRDIPSPYEITKADVVVEDVYAKARPPKELLQEVSPAKFYNKRIGDILRVLTENLENTSLVYEPNVNAGLVVNIQTGKMKLFELMKMVVESAGYYLYYNDQRKAIVVTQMKEMKYYIPAGIFIDRKVNVSLGNTKGDGGGGASGDINLNADNPAEALRTALDQLGSKDKIYSFDKDTGLLVMKEHALYVPEITQFIYDFVKDRSRKFIVEMAIVDVKLDSNRERTLDITSLVGKLGDFSINALTGGQGISISPRAGNLASGKAFSVDSVINLLNQYTSNEIVDQSKSVVANHSIKYMGNLTSTEYVSEVNANYRGDNSSNLEISLEKDEIKDGIQFTARIDAYNKKDYIDVSIAPSLSYGTLAPAGTKEGITFYNKLQQVREMLATATIRSGDIIITGGLLKDKDDYRRRTDPLTENWTPLGSKANQKTRVETLFIVKVTELHDPSQTFNIPTGLARPVAEDKVK